MSNLKLDLKMAQIKNSILDYLTEQLEINSESLKQYEGDKLLPDNTPSDIRQIREIEAIKLRDRIHELTRHLSAIKRIIPIADGTENANSKSIKKPATGKD